MNGDEFDVRLADANEIGITSYETGFKTGVKMVLDGFRSTGQKAPGAPVGLRLVLTLCLEGADEELVAEAAAIERGAAVRELSRPKEPDGREVEAVGPLPLCLIALRQVVASAAATDHASRAGCA